MNIGRSADWRRREPVIPLTGPAAIVRHRPVRSRSGKTAVQPVFTELTERIRTNTHRYPAGGCDGHAGSATPRVERLDRQFDPTALLREPVRVVTETGQQLRHTVRHDLLPIVVPGFCDIKILHSRYAWSPVPGSSCRCADFIYLTVRIRLITHCRALLPGPRVRHGQQRSRRRRSARSPC